MKQESTQSADATNNSMQIEYELEKNQMKNIYEDLTQLFKEKDTPEDSSRPKKRILDEDSNEVWTEVSNRKQRMREIRNDKEVCITSKEAFPKRFAFAKLLNEQNISNIIKVKYINDYKISIKMDSINAERLIKCEEFIKTGWRFQRPYEVDLSYGVIKNIEVDLSEAELLKSISCETEISNVRRLKRKIVGETEWIDCETIRVGFKGPILPKYIYLYDMRVKVEPYVFPVTQCSKCWRYGHTHKMCASKKSYCPKCAGKHETCETTTLKCINCLGSHMAMHKSCPVYTREKYIRDIMAESNCTYRKAMTVYNSQSIRERLENHNNHIEPDLRDQPLTPASDTTNDQNVTYAQKSKSSISPRERLTKDKQDKAATSKTSVIKKTNQKKNEHLNVDDTQSFTEIQCDVNPDKNDQSDSVEMEDTEANIYNSFKRLFLKIKHIILQRDLSSIDKIHSAVQTCLEFAISFMFKNISDWSFLSKFITNYGQGI